VKECIHRIAIKDFKGCNNTDADKNTIVCEFPDWEGKECPFTMLENGQLTIDEFYQLWLKAVKLDTQNKEPAKK
jgi:N-acetylmuramoyl-L-alanine amidase CwlA